jgi:hypothetical protein
VIARALNAFTQWALSKNAPGGYEGEDDPRWAYTIQTNGDPYLTRVLLSRLLPIRRWFGIGVYLHHFHREDRDRWLHNHPWTWAASIVLNGSYVEQRLEGMVGKEQIDEVRTVTRFNFLRDTDYHKVLRMRGDVWTLFITGKESQDWGFLVDGVHVPHKKYLGKE